MKGEHTLRGWAYFTYPARLCESITPRQDTYRTFGQTSTGSIRHIVYIETVRSSPILVSGRRIRGATMISDENQDVETTSAMAKSYTKQLTEWVRQTRPSVRRHRNRVAFMAVKNDVREALEKGWPVKTIWAHMVEQKRIECGYDTFLVYVKRHMTATTEPPGANRSSQPPGPSLATEAGRSGQPKAETTLCKDEVSHGPEPMSGFSFKAAPNREELI